MTVRVFSNSRAVERNLNRSKSVISFQFGYSPIRRKTLKTAKSHDFFRRSHTKERARN
jgi:hypothetical protein